MNNLVQMQKVSKTFSLPGGPPLPILRDISLSICGGDKIAILGRSGAGKSTLLHILGTLETPSEGHVSFGGQDVFQFSESQLAEFRNRSLGFIFQFHYLMLEFTALENVMMPALIGHVPRRTALQKAEQLLDLVGLADRVHHRPGQLSGGEQQRVAIARALMMDPKLLLTDEMTGNLDPDTGNSVFDLVQGLQAQFGMALVSVTHDESLAKQYPTVYRLTEGHLERS